MGLLDSVSGGTPWGAIGQTALGVGQAIFGGIQAHKAQKKLENLQTPTYNPSKSIIDYYNNALQRYNTNPYTSQQYQYALQNSARNQAAGINALQSRQSAVGGISRMTAIANDNALKAGVQAEQEGNQRFGQLGQAAQMRGAEDMNAFQYNKLAPYEKQFNLLAAKAGGGNQIANAGISNAFGGLQNISDYGMAKNIYGGGGGGSIFDFGGGGRYSPDYQSAKKYGVIH